MRLLKSFIIIPAIVLIIFIALIAGLAASLDDEACRRILIWSADHFSDYKVTIEDPFYIDLFSMEPSLSASGIQIEPDEKGVQPLIARIERLKIRLSLKEIFSGNILIRNLSARDASISYTTADLTLHAGIETLSIDDAQDEGTMYITSEGSINDTDFLASGLVKGNILKPQEIENTGLKLKISGKNTKVLKFFLYDWLPDTGPVTGEARISGPVKRLGLEGLTLKAGTPETALVNVKGRIGVIPALSDAPVSDIDLSIDINSHKPEVLFSGLNMSLPEMSTVTGQAHMHGDSDKLFFDGISVQASDPEGVRLILAGTSVLEQREDKNPLGLLELDVKMEAPSVASFRRLMAAKALPDLSPAVFTCRISGNTEILSLEDINIRAGTPGTVLFSWRGRIGKVAFGEDQPVSDVKLLSTLYTEKTSLLSPFIGLPIPDLGPLKSSSYVVVRKEGYGTDNIELLIGSKDNVRLKATGSIEYVMRGTTVGMDGIDLAVTIPGLDGQPFSALLGQRIADIGTLSGSLSISGDQEDLSVSGIDLTTRSPDGLQTSARGSVKHIRVKEKTPVHGIDMELSASAPDMTSVRKITGMDLPELGQLSVQIGMKNPDGALNFDPLQIRTGKEENPSLLIEGTMHSKSGLDSVTGRLTFKTQTGLWAETYLGHPVPEDNLLEGDIEFSGTKNKERLEGTIGVGKTKFLAAADRVRANGRSRFTANISSSKVYLSDIYIYPEVPPESKDKTEKSDKSSGKKLFSDKPLRFDRLKEFDLSLDLKVDEVAGEDFTLHDLNFNLSLDRGLLQKKLPKLVHENGYVSFEATVDTRGPKPALEVKASAKDIDAASVLEHMHSSFILGGDLTAAFDLQSTGGSPREIASALNGEFGFTIENGQIKGEVDLMGADAIDLLTTAGKTEGYEKLNCLAVMFDFNNGIGTSQIIYLDTPDVRSRGKGTVNLNEESLDFVIQPSPKKKQLGGSSPVRVSGPLTSPDVLKVPYMEAARLTGDILMPFVFLPIRAASYTGSFLLDDKDGKSPCFLQDK